MMENLPQTPVDRLSQALAVVRQDVKSMHAYAVQDATGMVKLDAMENPYVLSAQLQAALGQRLGQVAVNRYPGMRIDDLKQALSTYVDMPSGMGLMLGNGSDELISLLAMACLGQQASIVSPEPGFVMYALSAKLQGLHYVGVPLTTNFELNVPAMLEAMRIHTPAIVYLANPNNPTANAWRVDDLMAVIDAAPGLVVVDEAYQPFANSTWLDHMRAQPQRFAHVLLMRTLSKFGLAGVRLGYMLGQSGLVAELDKLRPPYNVSALNAECALFALEHEAVFAEQAAAIRAQRERMLVQLGSLPGLQVFPSQANMILVRVADAAKTFAALKAAGVLVKNVSTMHTLLHNCLRLTVGTPAENDQLLEALTLDALKAAV
jgi:histidinol-phosphate aminotransferase